MKTTPLSKIASVIRSKNAGPFLLTFDILFEEKENYDHVINSNSFNIKNLSTLLKITESQIKSIHTMPKGNAIKFTIIRPKAQGSFGESDMYGCQQHSPLLSMPIPV